MSCCAKALTAVPTSQPVADLLVSSRSQARCARCGDSGVWRAVHGDSWATHGWCLRRRKTALRHAAECLPGSSVIKLRRMNAPPPDASRQVMPSPGDTGETALTPGPILSPPVTVGPIAASSLGGVPFIAINGPVHHYSGKRLTQFILNALGEVGVTIDVPE